MRSHFSEVLSSSGLALWVCLQVMTAAVYFYKRSQQRVWLLFTHSVLSDSLWPHGLQHTWFLVLQYLPEFAQTHVHWIGDAIHPSHSLSSPSPSAFSLSQHQGLFQWVGSLNQVGQSIGASVLPRNIQGWFPLVLLVLLVVQGTLKSILQRHSSKASILRHSAFFIVQLSHPYMTIGQTIALTRQTFVGKVMSLLFNMLSRLVITFLPRSKHLLISLLQSHT